MQTQPALQTWTWTSSWRNTTKEFHQQPVSGCSPHALPVSSQPKQKITLPSKQTSDELQTPPSCMSPLTTQIGEAPKVRMSKSRGWQISSVKGQTVNIFSSMDSTVSLRNTQLGLCSRKAPQIEPKQTGMTVSQYRFIYKN